MLDAAMHIKDVPGRMTDVNGATSVEDLPAVGLIRASFVPPTPIQDRWRHMQGDGPQSSEGDPIRCTGK